jgi:hypothetical protein
MENPRIVEAIAKSISCPTDKRPIKAERREADLIAVTLPSAQTGMAFKTKQHTKLVYSKRAKRVTLQRYLVSKVVYEMEKVTFQDVLVLYDNMVWLQDKAEREIHFRDKFGVPLEVLSSILSGLNLTERTYQKSIRKLSRTFRKQLEGFYLPLRNYPNVQQRQRQAFRFVLNGPLGVELRQLPPKQYIGKGYDDKGTARDSAKDGSPSWQEVAMQPIEQTEVSQ